jgi:hypothetical protein
VSIAYPQKTVSPDQPTADQPDSPEAGRGSAAGDYAPTPITHRSPLAGLVAPLVFSLVASTVCSLARRARLRS